MICDVQTKKWGNSVGVVIPIEIIQKMNIKPEEHLTIEINKKENVLKELFGAFKFNKSTEQILKEVRRDLESKWLKTKNV